MEAPKAERISGERMREGDVARDTFRWTRGSPRNPCRIQPVTFRGLVEQDTIIVVKWRIDVIYS